MMLLWLQASLEVVVTASRLCHRRLETVKGSCDGWLAPLAVAELTAGAGAPFDLMRKFNLDDEAKI
jgi:hypothetical protein